MHFKHQLTEVRNRRAYRQMVKWTGGQSYRWTWLFTCWIASNQETVLSLFILIRRRNENSDLSHFFILWSSFWAP